MADRKLRSAGLAALAVGAAAVAAIVLIRTRTTPATDDHRQARQQILYYTLSRVDDPIIVLGDSIVEASTLPRGACGHAIINAGLNGASTASGLSNWLAAALANKRAAAIIVALGTNDALMNAPSEPAFTKRYGKLLVGLSKLTRHLAILGIPPVEARERLTADMAKEIMTSIDLLNAALPNIARQANATLLPLSGMQSPHTIDGIHLNADGYRIWDAAIMRGAAIACG